MAAKTMKITFTLDEADVAYFRNLHKKARREAKSLDVDAVIKEVRELTKKVRALRRIPSFVREAIGTLDEMIRIIEDEDYGVPAKVKHEIVAALAYFANPEDLVPDTVPGLGYLDDAIMVKIMSDEFSAELWGYKKFCAFRDGAEHRPWTPVGSERLKRRLTAKRDELRGKIEERKARKTIW